MWRERVHIMRGPAGARTRRALKFPSLWLQRQLLVKSTLFCCMLPGLQVEFGGLGEYFLWGFRSPFHTANWTPSWRRHSHHQDWFALWKNKVYLAIKGPSILWCVMRVASLSRLFRFPDVKWLFHLTLSSNRPILLHLKLKWKKLFSQLKESKWCQILDMRLLSNAELPGAEDVTQLAECLPNLEHGFGPEHKMKGMGGKWL